MKTEREMNRLMREALAPHVEPDRELNENLIRMWDSQHSDNPSDNPEASSDRKHVLKQGTGGSGSISFASGKGRKVTVMKNRRKASIVAAAAVCVLAVSTTAAATVKYLSREEIITEMGEKGAASAFEQGNTLDINQTAEAGDYLFRLYSIATQEELAESGLDEELMGGGGTYVVVSVERKDGTPMPEPDSDAYGTLTFFVSPLIQGLKPWDYNIASMGGSYSEIVKNGILYRITKCDDIALFADRQIYLSILDTAFYQKDAYDYNEADGTITRNEAYEGINLLFELPIDKSRADEEKAAEYLRELEESRKGEGTEMIVSEDGIVETGSEVLDHIIRQERAKGADVTGLEDIPDEVLISYGTLDEDSVKVLTPAADGMITYTYFRKDGSGGTDATLSLKELLEMLPDGRTGTLLMGMGITDNGKEEVTLTVFTRDADGTMKGMEYIITE